MILLFFSWGKEASIRKGGTQKDLDTKGDIET